MLTLARAGGVDGAAQSYSREAMRGRLAVSFVSTIDVRLPEGFLIKVIDDPGAEWESCEAAIDTLGTPLPLYHRAIWARQRMLSGVKCSLVSLASANGVCRAAFAIESSASRALPRHRLLLVTRLGIGTGGLDESTLNEGLAYLAALAREERSVLRASVEIFSLDSESRRFIAEVLSRNGFVRVPPSRTYERTLVLDLGPSEEQLFAGLHKNARQGIRSVARFPVRVSTATSLSLAARLQELSDETRARTGGAPRRLDWDAIIEMSAQAPQLSRIAVLERTDRTGPDRILAFAWGCLHGDVGEYSESGSTRADDLKVSTSYALLWDLITWARKGGAHTFDLGGVTSGITHSGDPLGGISDFKRRFSQREIEVGEEWELVPRPRRAVVAGIVSRAAGVLRSTYAWVRKPA